MSFYLFIAISFYPFISILRAKILCVNQAEVKASIQGEKAFFLNKVKMWVLVSQIILSMDRYPLYISGGTCTVTWRLSTGVKLPTGDQLSWHEPELLLRCVAYLLPDLKSILAKCLCT
jgi:hypothetical protein